MRLLPHVPHVAGEARAAPPFLLLRVEEPLHDGGALRLLPVALHRPQAVHVEDLVLAMRAGSGHGGDDLRDGAWRPEVGQRPGDLAIHLRRAGGELLEQGRADRREARVVPHADAADEREVHGPQDADEVLPRRASSDQLRLPSEHRRDVGRHTRRLRQGDLRVDRRRERRDCERSFPPEVAIDPAQQVPRRVPEVPVRTREQRQHVGDGIEWRRHRRVDAGTYQPLDGASLHQRVLILEPRDKRRARLGRTDAGRVGARRPHAPRWRCRPRAWSAMRYPASARARAAVPAPVRGVALGRCPTRWP